MILKFRKINFINKKIINKNKRYSFLKYLDNKNNKLVFKIKKFFYYFKLKYIGRNNNIFKFLNNYCNISINFKNVSAIQQLNYDKNK